MKRLLLFLSIIAAASSSTEDKNVERRKRMFSIFSVVNFPNTQCTVLSTANTNSVMFGTCQSTDTCTSNGGTADGNCASGFGVCCMFTTSTCGTTISKNLTYFTNPGFPTSFGTVGPCTFNFEASSDICQIRLDFDNFVIANPSSATGAQSVGSCSILDRFAITGPTGVNPPTICGINSGQHMYFETGQRTNAGSATFTLVNPAVVTPQTRTWKVKTTFFECAATYRAPTDCVQFLIGETGNFRSFNFQTTTPQNLNSQNYNICIRQEEGFCSIDFAINGDESVAPVPFKVDKGGGSAVIQIAKRVCTDSFVQIRTTVNSVSKNAAGMLISNTETHCGSRFNFQSESKVSGRVTSTVLPFTVGVFAQAVFTDDANSGAPGFNLMYSQNPC